MSSIGTGKRIFITGAAGHVGSVITELAIVKGFEVRGLSRSEKSDAKLKALGATPVRGDLHATDVLRNESAQADIVMHLADSFLDRGGAPKDYEEVIRIDGAAVDALAEPLKGTDKALLVTSGTLISAPDPSGAETDETSPAVPNPPIDRHRSERYALSYADKGVRVIAIRLAPYVYGRGGSGVYMFMDMAVKNKQAAYVDDGEFQTTTVHVDDAARLYLLAAEKAKAGDVFNCSGQTTITSRQLSEAMGAALHVPAVSLTKEEASAKLGPFLPIFLTMKNRASSAKAKKQLGWQPQEPGLLEDIASGSYHDVAQAMLNGRS